MQQDGVEIYALYIMVFVNSVTAFTLSSMIRHLEGKLIRHILVALFVVISCLYCAIIGFIPPMNTTQHTQLFVVIQQSFLIMAVVFSLLSLLNYLHWRSSRWGLVTVAIILVPVCFIATSPISRIDYSYVFAPALRLLNGAAISDVFFQYDLLLSLLAAGWMKLGLNLNAFQILGQATYFIAILGVFIFSRKLFQKKELSLFLLAALVLGRVYASPYDIVLCFQTTPLRLDLWLPLLVVVYWRGPYHWSVGLVCGLLILLHNNFGIIYTLAYIQLLITLWAIGYFKDERRDSLRRSLLDYGKLCSVSFMMIVFLSLASYLLFSNNEFGKYSDYYQKIGIGFMKIARNSFYWYIPPMLSIVIILLFRMRKHITPSYLATGFLLTYCVIGNSTYFFGRSHEHNIINISIALIFSFFLMLDLITRFLNEGARSSFLRRHAGISVAVAFIAVMIVSYSQNILTKSVTQIKNAGNAQLIYPPNLDMSFLKNYINTIRTVTGNSSKVYFISNADFELYYYGGYAPVGYCNPFQTWIFTKDIIHFLQELLDKGYYLVSSAEMQYLLTNLHYNYNTLAGDIVVVARLTNQEP